MKKISIIFCMLILSCAAFGQQIKKQNVELDDLLSLLNYAGYEIFSFDISEMLNERYDIVLVMKEYEAGNEIASSNFATVPNKRLLTDFPESQWQQMIDAGRVIDPITQATAHVEKISFGFSPSNNDSTKYIQINAPNMLMRSPLKLRGLTIKAWDRKVFSYYTKPFKIDTFEVDKFIPLVLFGSSWYDERINVLRFCGEREINPDMSSEILKDVPHHYVFGVRFVKKQ